MRGGRGQVIGAAERLTLTLVYLKVKDISGSTSSRASPTSPSLARPGLLEGVGLVWVHLARGARLLRLPVHAVELDLIPLLRIRRCRTVWGSVDGVGWCRAG